MFAYPYFMMMMMIIISSMKMFQPVAREADLQQYDTALLMCIVGRSHVCMEF